jgi:hypothetical protein
LKDTALYRVPIWAYNLTVGRLLHKSKDAKYDDTSSDDDEPAAEADLGGEDAEDFEVLDKVKTTSPNGAGNGKTVKRNKKSARGR